MQWAASSRTVFSLDANAGRTSHGQVHSWNTFYPPDTVLNSNNLGGRSYIMAGLGADYAPKPKWHLLANITYWRFNYGQSSTNAIDVLEPTSNTRLLTTTVGLGYAI